MKKEPKCKNNEKFHVYHDRFINADNGETSMIRETCSICGVVKAETCGESGTVSREFFRTEYDPKTDDEFSHERQNCREGSSVHLWNHTDWEYFCVPTEGAISKVIDKKCERCDVVRRECVFRENKGSSVTYSRRTTQDKGIEA